MAYKKEDYEAAIKLAQQAAQQKQQQATVPGTAASGNAVATSQPKPTVNQGTNPDTSLKSYEQNRPTYQPNTPVQNILNGTKNYETNKPGAYQGTYADQIQGLLNKILNKEKFEYDMNADPLYQQYKDQYTKNGALAMRDTMGAAAALTGGYGSSYATTAASQTYDKYMDALNARVPELQQLAYGQYRDEVSDQYNQLGALQNQDSIDYGRYRDTVGDWQADRQYYYGKDYDKQQQLNYMSAQEYQQYQDALNAWLNDRQYGYGKDYDAQQQKNRDEEFGYKKETDALAQENYLSERAYQEAMDKIAQDQWKQNFDFNTEWTQKQFDENVRQFDTDNDYRYTSMYTSKQLQDAALALEREQFEYGKTADSAANSRWAQELELERQKAEWDRDYKNKTLEVKTDSSANSMENRKYLNSLVNGWIESTGNRRQAIQNVFNLGLGDDMETMVLRDAGLLDEAITYLEQQEKEEAAKAMLPEIIKNFGNPFGNPFN